MMFTICIPTYNRLQDLRICLASVFTAIKVLGGAESVEVLVSDNASSDGTGEWLREMDVGDHKIRFSSWANTENIGAVRNIKKLLTKATGEYVFFLADDDLLMPNTLEVVKSYILADSPKYIQVANVTYLTKRKRCFYYGPARDLKDKHDPSEFVELCRYSHVLSGCVVRNSTEQIQLLNESANAYPTIELCAINAGNCLSISRPLVWHQWENEIFWEKDVDMSSESSKRKKLNSDAQLALRHIPDGFLDTKSASRLYERLVETYGYVEAELADLFRELGFLNSCRIRGKVKIVHGARSMLRKFTSIVRPS